MVIIRTYPSRLGRFHKELRQYMPEDIATLTLVPPLKTSDACRELGIRKPALMELIRKKILIGYKLGDQKTGHWRFWPEDIKACCQRVDPAALRNAG